MPATRFITSCKGQRAVKRAREQGKKQRCRVVTNVEGANGCAPVTETALYAPPSTLGLSQETAVKSEKPLSSPSFFVSLQETTPPTSRRGASATTTSSANAISSTNCVGRSKTAGVKKLVSPKGQQTS